MRVKQIPNYELIIKTNSYVGNFERELISYAFGTLDNVQMEMGSFHGDYEMDLFWKEEFGTDRKGYYDDYDLKDKYLFETFQDVDDWEQMIFYYMIDGYNTLAVQLYQPLDEFWEEIVIRRIKKFFEIKPCKYSHTISEDCKLIDLYLIDSSQNIIKRYI